MTGGSGAGVRDVTTTELSPMSGLPRARDRSAGRQLRQAAELAAQRLVPGGMGLDTRHDLVEARALYTKYGYREIEAPDHRLYADHWCEKRPALG
ncbi:hypothetical protein [Amycolatopsis viridis]|uniref:Acetyltransferase n=1 Tax=Amycolatopsis viridis TaxID=185678 RepID=A0ABX0SPW6_9PSEU|nr:hypothetical protein [Amycolatopsis viridis]NIH79009.1 hypothetical protein [Amycolatopsis viridis]